MFYDVKINDILFMTKSFKHFLLLQPPLFHDKPICENTIYLATIGHNNLEKRNRKRTMMKFK